jgi:hypothetical protein
MGLQLGLSESRESCRFDNAPAAQSSASIKSIPSEMTVLVCVDPETESLPVVPMRSGFRTLLLYDPVRMNEP